MRLYWLLSNSTSSISGPKHRQLTLRLKREENILTAWCSRCRRQADVVYAEKSPTSAEIKTACWVCGSERVWKLQALSTRGFPTQAVADVCELGPYNRDKHLLSKSEHFEIFRDYMIRENDLINHRLTWGLGIQAFLFAAFGVALQAAVAAKAEILASDHNQREEALSRLGAQLDFQQLNLVLLGIPILGIATIAVVFISVRAARMALKRLSEDWENKVRNEYPSEPFLPQPMGGGCPRADNLGFIASTWIPGIVLAAWLIALVLAAIRK